VLASETTTEATLALAGKLAYGTLETTGGRRRLAFDITP
jgi:hypothetical protein